MSVVPEQTAAKSKRKPKQAIPSASPESAQTEITVTSKRHPNSGRYPKITPEIINSIASLVCRGMPLEHACARQTPPFPASHFEQAMVKSPHLSLCRLKREGDRMLEFLDLMNDPETKLRGMPASVWIWERRFPQHFAPPKQGGSSVTINNNTTVIGVEEQVAARVASMVRELGKSAPKQLKQAQVIDVESEHSRK